jgi:hypothetical protein
MKKLLLILVCLPLIGFGQVWEQIINSVSSGESIHQTNDGGYIITGDPNNNNIPLLKTDANGILEWQKSFNAYEGEGKVVNQTTDGGYIIFATDYDSPSEISIIKTDLFGNLEWERRYDGTVFDGQQTNDGGYILCASESSGGFIMKLDLDGYEEWRENFQVYSVRQTIDQGYIAIGYNTLVKINENGNFEWSQPVGGELVRQTQDQGFVAISQSSSNSVIVRKHNSTGNEEWSQIFNGLGGEFYADDIEQTNDGGYVFVGMIDSLNGIESVSVNKINNQGLLEWHRIFGSSYEDFGRSVEQTNDGGYIISGKTNDQLYIIKTNSQGTLTETIYIPIETENKITKTISLLGKETKPQTNTPFIEIYDDGTVEKRIIVE